MLVTGAVARPARVLLCVSTSRTDILCDFTTAPPQGGLHHCQDDFIIITIIVIVVVVVLGAAWCPSATIGEH